MHLLSQSFIGVVFSYTIYLQVLLIWLCWLSLQRILILHMVFLIWGVAGSVYEKFVKKSVKYTSPMSTFYTFLRPKFCNFCSIGIHGGKICYLLQLRFVSCGFGENKAVIDIISTYICSSCIFLNNPFELRSIYNARVGWRDV